jgi:hypothetical protein
VKQEYVELEIQVIGETHRARVLQTLTIERLLDNIRREFDGEIPEAPDDTPYCLWQPTDVHPLNRHIQAGELDLRRPVHFNTADHAPNIYDFVNKVDQAKLQEVGSQPLEDHTEFWLRTPNGKILQSNRIPIVIGRSPTPIEYQMHHQPILAEFFDDPEDEKSISREHIALFRRTEEHAQRKRFYVVQLNDRNPTFINNVPMDYMYAYPLQNGDVITLGKRNFTLTFTSR